jgi:acyl dehydratase
MAIVFLCTDGNQMDSLWFDDVEVGQRWLSPARTLTESDVVNFASMTGDYNPLHVDHDYASKSIYRQPIAHGLLGLSWVAGLGSSAPLMRTLAFTSVKQWEFLLPIYFGDTVHVVTRCLAKKRKGKKSGQIVWERQLVNQKDQVVQQGQFETLVAIEQTADAETPDLPTVDLPAIDLAVTDWHSVDVSQGIQGPKFTDAALKKRISE